jgi:hypothetical protein
VGAMASRRPVIRRVPLWSGGKERETTGPPDGVERSGGGLRPGFLLVNGPAKLLSGGQGTKTWSDAEFPSVIDG